MRSFVSYALALGPTATIDSHRLNERIEFRFNSQKKLSDQGVASLDTLIEKYEKVRRYIPEGKALDDLEIHKARPEVTFEPGKRYKLVSIPAEQLTLAKDLAKRVGKLHTAHRAGKHDEARREYDALTSFLSEKRSAFLADFKDVPEIDQVIGGHAVGRSGDVNAMNGGEVIFVCIEIFVTVP